MRLAASWVMVAVKAIDCAAASLALIACSKSTALGSSSGANLATAFAGALVPVLVCACWACTVAHSVNAAASSSRGARQRPRLVAPKAQRLFIRLLHVARRDRRGPRRVIQGAPRTQPSLRCVARRELA